MTALLERLKGYAWAAGCLTASAGVIALAIWLFAVSADLKRTERERRALQAWRDEVCGLLSPLPAGIGKECRDRLVWVIGFYTKATSQSNQALVEAENERVRKLESDNAARARNAQRLEAELKRLKEISAHVKDDVVGPDYWAALNRVAGVRPATGAAAGSAGGGHQDPAGPAP